MADLSRVQNRVTAQNRVTNNRDSIIPGRRDTDAGPRRVFNDVRNGSRGDGGVAELRRALGLVQDAAGSFKDYADQKFADTEEKLGSQGAFDAASGHEDPELMRKSLAYRNSVFTQRAQTAYYQNAEKLDDEIKGIVNSDDPELADPAKRGAAIQAAINRNFQEFAIDPDSGKLRDWGSPAAAKWLGQNMSAARAEVAAKALQLVENKANTDSINNAAEAFGASIDAGRPMPFEDAMANLLPTVDRKEAKQKLILVAKDRAASLTEKAAELDETDPQQAQQLRIQALGVIDTIRGSKRTNDPLAPTPEGEKPVASGAYYKPTVEPFEGFSSAKTSSGLGAGREGGSRHNGEDFPMNVGTAVKAPMDGEVIASFRNRRGGNQVRIRMANGAIVGYAHLSKRDVKVGDKVSAGQVVALSGNTGHSTGPHLHMTLEQGGKKVSPSAYFKDVSSASASAGPLPEATDPPTSSELASADPVGASSSLFSLTPEERADLGAFRRQLKSDIDTADRQALDKRQTNTAMDYMARFHGLGGSYPTPSEITNAARSGDISVQHAVQLLGVYESDQREARAEVREQRADERAARSDAREAKADAVDSYAGDILGKLASGKYRDGARGANAELLKLLPTISDKDIRTAVYAEVKRGIDQTVELRNATPQYRQAMGQFDEWEAVYLSQVTKGRLIPPKYRGRAEVMVKEWINTWRVRLAQDAALDPEKVSRFMEFAEKDLDARVDRTFPSRASRVQRGTSTGTRTMH